MFSRQNQYNLFFLSMTMNTWNTQREMLKSNRLLSGKKYAFRRMRRRDRLDTDYDYDSIMHYGPYAFAKDPFVPTIVSLDLRRLYRNHDLSDVDKERVHLHYGFINPVSISTK